VPFIGRGGEANGQEGGSQQRLGGASMEVSDRMRNGTVEEGKRSKVNRGGSSGQFGCSRGGGWHGARNAAAATHRW
jgi:hypothetical protein